jgi:hypothetical protein
MMQDELQIKEVYKFQKEADSLYDHDPATFATLREKIKDTFCIT